MLSCCHPWGRAGPGLTWVWVQITALSLTLGCVILPKLLNLSEPVSPGRKCS